MYYFQGAKIIPASYYLASIRADFQANATTIKE